MRREKRTSFFSYKRKKGGEKKIAGEHPGLPAPQNGRRFAEVRSVITAAPTKICTYSQPCGTDGLHGANGGVAADIDDTYKRMGYTRCCSIRQRAAAPKPRAYASKNNRRRVLRSGGAPTKTTAGAMKRGTKPGRDVFNQYHPFPQIISFRKYAAVCTMKIHPSPHGSGFEDSPGGDTAANLFRRRKDAAHPAFAAMGSRGMPRAVFLQLFRPHEKVERFPAPLAARFG